MHALLRPVRHVVRPVGLQSLGKLVRERRTDGKRQCEHEHERSGGRVDERVAGADRADVAGLGMVIVQE